MNRLDAHTHQLKSDFRFRLNQEDLEFWVSVISDLLRFSNKSYRKITETDIRNWLSSLEGTETTLRLSAKLLGVKMFYRFCIRVGVIGKDPAFSISYPVYEDDNSGYLLEDQLNQLRLLLDGNLKERALVELIYATGLRNNELLGVQVEDINWDERSIWVRNKTHVGRRVYFNHVCENHLKAYLVIRSDKLPFLFLNIDESGPMHNQDLRVLFQQYQEKLDFHVTPHTLRCTFADHLCFEELGYEHILEVLGLNETSSVSLNEVRENV